MHDGNWILSLLPMLLLIGAWFFFMQRMRSPGSYQTLHLDLMRRQVEALEKIAAAAEKRAP